MAGWGILAAMFLLAAAGMTVIAIRAASAQARATGPATDPATSAV
jgi:hypothetical protein